MSRAEMFYADETSYGARPVVKDPRSPRAEVHHIPLARLGAYIRAETPDPPCTGCGLYDRCAARATACEAWRAYASRGAVELDVRGQGHKPLRKFRD